VVAEADGARSGIEAAEAAALEVVVLDVHLRDGNGIAVCRALAPFRTVDTRHVAQRCISTL